MDYISNMTPSEVFVAAAAGVVSVATVGIFVACVVQHKCGRWFGKSRYEEHDSDFV